MALNFFDFVLDPFFIFTFYFSVFPNVFFVVVIGGWLGGPPESQVGGKRGPRVNLTAC